MSSIIGAATERCLRLGTMAIVACVAGCSNTAGPVDGSADTQNGDAANVEQNEIAVPVILDNGVVEVEAGVPFETSEVASVAFATAEVRGGRIGIDPRAVMVFRNVLGRSAHGTGDSIVIHVRIVPVDASGSCEDGAGDDYGPFTVFIDEFGMTSEVRPRSVPLEKSTIDVLDEFLLCIRIEAPGVNAQINLLNLTLELDVEAEGACNLPCGFDNGGPEGRAAAALCGVTSSAAQSSFLGSATDGFDCRADEDCADEDPCTINECIGAVVFICEARPSMNCQQNVVVLSNGQNMFIDFDHSVISATVNGRPTFDEGATWNVEGLAEGRQTLFIEWLNRPGADPQHGCQYIEVDVNP